MEWTAKGALWYVFENTKTYQDSVRSLVCIGDRSLEIGSANGATTALLTKYCQYAVGVDSSWKELEKARVRYPSVQFQYLDASSAEEVNAFSGKHPHFDVIFVDVGGIRPLNQLLPILFNIEKSLKPRALVIKSVFLYRLQNRFQTLSNTNKQPERISSDQLRRMRVKNSILSRFNQLGIPFETVSCFKPISESTTQTTPRKAFDRAQLCELKLPLFRMLLCVTTETDSQQLVCVILPPYLPFSHRNDISNPCSDSILVCASKKLGLTLKCASAKELKAREKIAALSGVEVPTQEFLKVQFDWQICSPISDQWKRPLLMVPEDLLRADDRCLLEVDLFEYISFSFNSFGHEYKTNQLECITFPT
uniref:Methyltransferase domain-containing protein n=1 Tax=Timspurckia oligopyrenoides TaxID=708627 RepID=A0A7S1EUH3_9RHOD|mmetsp:Transcript_83/g.143  ORF Transcript_83/g.143 Transcript_83/m.143 type:complete len:364 (+) Transcript_83:27-1118(+)